MNHFTCPHCENRPLERHEGIAVCSGCRRSFELGDRWLDARGLEDYYWGELDRAVMQSILDSPVPARPELLHRMAGVSPDLRHYLYHTAFDSKRAAWKFLLGLRRGGTVLDVGCGLGAVSLAMTGEAGRIIAMDIVPERVRFTLRRLREETSVDAWGIVSSGLPHLPLETASVDTVVLNGVLEWIPDSVPGDPEGVQRALLCELARVLKPDGCLYLGIENRFGASYFIGRREEHTHLRYVSLMPRMVGRLYHRLAKRRPYRTFTHSRRHLESMFRDAGFQSTVVYAPYPDYREFSSMVAVDNPRWVRATFSPRSRRGRLAHWVSSRTHLLSHFANSLGVVAARAPHMSTFTDRLMAHLKSRDVIGADHAPLGYHVRSTGVVSLPCGVDKPVWLISVPLHAEAGQRLCRDAAFARSLNPYVKGHRLESTVVPDLEQEFEGHNCLITPWAQGKRLSLLSGTRRARAETEAWRWLAEFHRLELGRACEGQARAMPQWKEETFQRLDLTVGGILGGFLNRCEAAGVRKTLVHGDFHDDNIFVAQDGSIERVVDWDLGSLSGFPVSDALTFVLRTRLEQGDGWGRALQFVYDLVIPSTRPHHPITAYMQHVELQTADRVAGLVVLPVLHLEAQMQYAPHSAQEIIDGTCHVFDTARVQLLDAVLLAEGM